MVHHTMATSSTSAASASSRINNMVRVLFLAGILGMLAACTSVPLPPQPPLQVPAPAVVTPPPPAAPEDGVLPAPVVRGKARWIPARWSELPGFAEDALHEAWNAWIRSCERPAPPHAGLCPEVRRLSIASADEQRAWMQRRLQPWRIEPLAREEGLLTGYYEPMLEASRVPTAAQQVPLYAPPADLARRRPWYTRQEIDTLPQARAGLRGREIAYVADPLDALSLQIQGSGRLRVTEADGRVSVVRLAFAGSNEQPYRSVGSWLLQQGALRDASWPGIKAWARANPQRLQELLWSNPRVVFFREEPLSDFDAGFGPRGAQGVPLTPGRSIAIEKDSVPYGTPMWLSTPGPLLPLNRLVFAQDTGSAIVGAVRADYFTGWGAEAGEVAGRLKQPLALWVLWPR
ncbi:MAG TPA: MltA domain-containing protein [Ramlibacter sp.]|uniref:murein transglycosylase A n=1 Tax=Ramlibacter sp. TaxID=1917967 RepID=UPI002D7FFA72|nr:MltA domain-containing protein [Ramlibacter sp.]HET8748049.1 MltA domain-containing protein [Ramlibacter sp.]